MGTLGKQVPTPTKREIPSRLPHFKLPSYIPTEGLVGCWLPFVGGGDSLKDYSGTGNNGTISGATWTYITGPGWILNYDGTDDYVDSPDDPSLDITDEITVSCWVNQDAIFGTNDRGIVTKNYNGSVVPYTLETKSTGGYRFGYYEGGVWTDVIAGSQEADNWVHLVGVFDGSDLILYKNGTEIGRNSGVGGPLPTDNLPLSIGGRAHWGGAIQNMLDGQIGSACIYNRTLSENRIKEIYEKTKPLYGS